MRSTTDSGSGRSRSRRETAAAFAVGEKEYIVSCRFAGPVERQGGSPLVQEGTCTASTGQAVSFRVNDEQGGKAHGLRVFAGRRMDPFFFDGVRAAQALMTGKLAFVSPGDSRQHRQNVLSIVVELDIATISERMPGRCSPSSGKR